MTNIGIYEKAFPDTLSLEEKLDLTYRFGFDFMELCIDTNPIRIERLCWQKEYCLLLRDYADKLGIPFQTLSLSYIRLLPLGSLDKNKNKKALSSIEKALQIAKFLGIKIMLLNAYDVYDEPSTEETFDRMIQNLLVVSKLAEKHNVVIGLENAEIEIGNSINKVATIVKKINSPYIKIYADIANSTIAYEGKTKKVEQELTIFKDDIVAVHLKDGLDNVYRGVPFGEGYVNFNVLIPILLKTNQKTLTVEYFNTDDWVNDLSQIKKILNNYF